MVSHLTLTQVFPVRIWTGPPFKEITMDVVACHKIVDRFSEMESGIVLTSHREDFEIFCDYLRNLNIDDLFVINHSHQALTSKTGSIKLRFHVLREDRWITLSGFCFNCIFVNRVSFDSKLLSRLRSPSRHTKLFLEYI